MKRIESGQLKFYDEDYFEFSEDDYFDNNSIINVKSKNCPFWVKLEGTLTCELFKINENKLNNNKNISEVKINNITLENENDKYYYKGASINTTGGIYRYIITIGTKKYYSESFCVKIITINGSSFNNFSDSNGNHFVDSNNNNFGQPI